MGISKIKPLTSQYHSVGGSRGWGLLCLAPQLVLVSGWLFKVIQGQDRKLGECFTIYRVRLKQDPSTKTSISSEWHNRFVTNEINCQRGGAEFAGPENGGPKTNKDCKMQDLENDGPNRRPGKCRTWKMMDPGIHQSWHVPSADRRSSKFCAFA